MDLRNKAGYQEIINENKTKRPEEVRRRNLKIGVGVLVLSLILILSLTLTIGDEKKKNNNKVRDVGALATAMSTTSMQSYLSDLYTLTMNSPSGSRSVVNAFDDAVDYIESQILTKTKYKATRQSFQVPIFEQQQQPAFVMTAPYYVNFLYNLDFNQFRYGGSGTFDGIMNRPVGFIANNGCEDGDFTDFVTNTVAVITLGGTCDSYSKALRAQQKGAAAVILANNATTTGIPRGNLKYVNWLPTDEMITILAIAATNTVPQLLRAPGATVSFPGGQSSIRNVETENICAETTEGNKNSIIVVGSHLDSVPEGPGMDDDGSGSAILLEMMVLLSNLKIKQQHKVRFCWWSAEEIGLMGSRYYVTNGDQEELEKIIANFNYDMLGSPNFVRYVLDGKTADDAAIRGRSEFLSQLHENYLTNELNVPWQWLPLSFGRSDFVPFSEVGIPVSGLFTGADGIKSAAERSIYGGLARAAHDTCYHQSCDTLENIDWTVLTQMARTAAYAVEYVAVNGFNGMEED